jgi:hypothetical protein
MYVWNGQGVIGDTFHFKSQAMRAASVDANDKVAAVHAYTDLVYPVFPDKAYEVPTLFCPQKMTFPADFIHGIIIHSIIPKRKAGVAKLATVSSLA